MLFSARAPPLSLGLSLENSRQWLVSASITVSISNVRVASPLERGQHYSALAVQVEGPRRASWFLPAPASYLPDSVYTEHRHRPVAGRQQARPVTENFSV